MTDSKKLSDEIADSGITITAIAKKLGITREGFYKNSIMKQNLRHQKYRHCRKSCG